MKILIFLSLLVISNCLTTPEPSSSISTTTETSADSYAVNDKSDEEKTESTATVERDTAGESIKSKRTLERNLGYGFNQPNAQSKFRTYPYQQLRHYSTLRTAAEHLDSRQHQNQQQAVAGHQPYSTAPSSSVGSHSSLQNYQTSKHAGTQEPVYFARPPYQQVPAYRGSPAVPGHSSGNGAHIFSSSGSPHASPFLSGPPPHAPVFFTGHSLASQHNPFTAVTSHNALNPFLAAGNFHGGSLLYQHPASSAVAFLQNPSGHLGPQILPVIIIRVNNDASGNSVFHHQGGVSPAFLQAGLHGLNLQTLLYPAQQFQAPQQAAYTRFEAVQTEQPLQLLYQEAFPSDENPKPQYSQPPAATAPQKVSYAYQKKPLIPTPAPDSSHQPEKLRKNVVVSDRDENEYSPYKYGYKDKV